MRGFTHWVLVVISREDAKKVGLNRQHTGGVLSNI